MTNLIDVPLVEDISLLPLDHPGANDPKYKQRREFIVSLAEKFRRNPAATLPTVEYTTEETETWSTAASRLQELHRKLANTQYLKSKQALGINTRKIPQLNELNEKLRPQNFFLAPVGGLIDARSFLSSLQNNIMLCTQYVRHSSRPDYTPEPDVIHEVIGHVPAFTNKEFVEFSKMIGRGAAIANEQQLQALERLYWFTVEFGLIEQQGEVRAFGAGLLSSFGELGHCFSGEVERKKFALDEVTSTEFSYSEMQTKLFIIPSFKYLKKITAQLIAGF